MPGCLEVEGLEWIGEVTEVTALWGEGIGRNSNTLQLQELGGLAPKFFGRICCEVGISNEKYPKHNMMEKIHISKFTDHFPVRSTKGRNKLKLTNINKIHRIHAT